MLSIEQEKFLIVRFAPGAGGKFLSTLFQCIDSVHAWDQELIIAKQQNDYNKIFSYVTSKFTTNFKDWQKNEPEVPYQTDFVSNRFDRGDDITFEQAAQLLVSDLKYQHDFNNDGLIVLVLNKSRIPAWLCNRSIIVNILIDTPASKKWFRRARLQKQFIKVDDNSYIIKQEHEDYCPPKRARLAAQFNNEKIFHGSWYSFVKKYIINDTVGNLFTNRQAVIAHPTNGTVKNFFFDLSSYLNEDQFVKQFQTLCTQIGVTPLPRAFLLKSIEYYQGLH